MPNITYHAIRILIFFLNRSVGWIWWDSSTNIFIPKNVHLLILVICTSIEFTSLISWKNFVQIIVHEAVLLIYSILPLPSTFPLMIQSLLLIILALMCGVVSRKIYSMAAYYADRDSDGDLILLPAFCFWLPIPIWILFN
jgi:hypothetical protein